MTLPQPGPTTRMNSSGYEHDLLHNDTSDLVEAHASRHEVGGADEIELEHTDASHTDVQLVIKSADETSVNNTIQDDNELLLPVEASSSYLVEAFLYASNAASTADIKVCMTASAGSWTMLGQWVGPGRTSLTVGTELDEAHVMLRVALLATPRAFAVIAGNASMITLRAVLKTDATPGNLKLQWAQNTTDAGNATTVHQDYSFLRLTKIA